MDKLDHSGNKRKQYQMILMMGLGASLALGQGQMTFADESIPIVRIAEPAKGTKTLVKSAGEQIQRSSDDYFAGIPSDLSFLNGRNGKGTEEEPYQIRTAAQLMGLSFLASRDMEIPEGEGSYPGDYRGAYFILQNDIDLEGTDWVPIGFYQSDADRFADLLHPFCGDFDGNGKKVENFRLGSIVWDHTGLFGAVEDSVIHDLEVRPVQTLTSSHTSGILVGSCERSRIANVRVKGSLRTDGTAGGVAGEVSDASVIENAVADHISIDTGSDDMAYAGGIAGELSSSMIADSEVMTGNHPSTCIHGTGPVGGIAGFQNDGDIFNVRVSGTVGADGNVATGGITGLYAGGKIKVAVFDGTIASSGLGSASREGTFIGDRKQGFHFEYGKNADLSYLFADRAGKIASGLCGTGLANDNMVSYEDHVGYYHNGDNFFTLTEGVRSRDETEKYFYEELEEGILNLIDTESEACENGWRPDHYAPNHVGKPEKGYLCSVLQIDTAANVENYYDVAVLTAKGESGYSKVLDREHRGAITPGDVVTVMTSPKNTETEKYQMDGVPYYRDEEGVVRKMDYQKGGSYTFVMPASDVEISADYVKVAGKISLKPEEMKFQVVEERKGDRKSPSIVTEVKDQDNRLIARYLNGDLEQGTKVEPVFVRAIVDESNDVSDSRVRYSLDDGELIRLRRNGDEDHDGYTEKSASLELNLEAGFFTDIRKKLEAQQAAGDYRDKIPDTIYGGGTGGIVVLTAETRPAASFEGKTYSANCRICVTYQIKDRTDVAAEGAVFDKDEIHFDVVRTLTGSRRNPSETITIPDPEELTASFHPDFFDKKEVKFESSDPAIVSVTAGDDKNALIRAVTDAGWIRNIITVDQEKKEKDPDAIQTGSGEKKVEIRVVASDTLGNQQTAVCPVTVRFHTDDRTYVYSGGGSHGGGSHSSGGGGGSSHSSGSGKGKETMVMGVKAPGSVTGDWHQEPDGRWTFESSGHSCRDEWGYIFNPYADGGKGSSDWFRFGSDGCMLTGWFQEPGSGDWFYLQDVSDGRRGTMLTGWQMINGKWYYLNPVSDGRRGAMLTGWHWIDGYCYDLKNPSGELFLSCTTPDGYEVNDKGQWTVSGQPVRKE